MDYEPCNFPSCLQPAVARVCGVRKRHINERWYYCGEHLPEFIATYDAAPRIGEGRRQRTNEGIGFDIEMFVLDDRPEKPCRFSLREIGGSRRLDCGIGFFDATMLWWHTELFDHPRPLSHPAMASIIAALGGELECAMIDRFFPGRTIAYEANLYIKQTSIRQLVDVRPIDAIVLAIVCKSLIVVAHKVLEQS